MMASTRRRAANQDLPRQPSLVSSSLSPLISDNAAGSISMEDLLNNIYPDPSNPNSSDNPRSDHVPDPPPPLFHDAAGSDGAKIVEEEWQEIDDGDGQQHCTDGFRTITLEDYLTKSTPVEAAAAAGPLAGPSVVVNGSLIQSQGQLGVAGGGGGGRGKRRASVQEEPPVDKATQQKHRRMIKNRESAARSRERKQAYTAELEAQVTQLEEENARLLREEAELIKEKREKLVKVVVPVTEGRRPQRTLRRVRSI